MSRYHSEPKAKNPSASNGKEILRYAQGDIVSGASSNPTRLSRLYGAAGRLQRVSQATLAVLLALATTLLPREAFAAPPSQEYTYAECSRADEAAVQSEMTSLAHGVLVEGSSGLQISSLVTTTWHSLGADVTFDAAVDAGITRVQAERGYWERFWSGWSADKAEEFAGQVATYAFEDAELQAKLDEISSAIAASLVLELESAAARSASSALLCLQSYVGEQYSATLFAAFEERVSQELAETSVDLSESGNVHISPLEMHGKGLTGVGVIVATQITRRVAQSLAQKITGRLAGKIAGRVLGRLGSSVVPYIGWAVGVGLLVWDLVEGSQGALPTIREALQAEEVKQEVRTEIAAAVADSVAAEIETLSSTMSATLVGQWQTFCADYAAICRMAAENNAFRTLLDNLPVTDLTRLVQLVDFFTLPPGMEAGVEPSTELDTQAGEQRLVTAIVDGTLAKLMAAPPIADEILAWTNSPAATLAWVELAGEQLPRVVELRLFETIDPLILPELSLATLLAIGDNAIIHKLQSLPTEHLLTLLQLPATTLTRVAADATLEDLGWLAEYLAGLPAKEAVTVVHGLESGEMTIATLQSPPVVAASDNTQAAGTQSSASPSTGVAQSPSNTTAPNGNPAAVAASSGAWWAPWVNNGVAVAAALVVLLLIAVGMVATLRRDIIDASK